MSAPAGSSEGPRKDSAPTQDVAWHHRHILDVDVLSWPEIELVMRTADEMNGILARPIRKVPALNGRRVTTLFYEASTRTRVSFETAARNLSADMVSIATSTSSVGLFFPAPICPISFGSLPRNNASCATH